MRPCAVSLPRHSFGSRDQCTWHSGAVCARVAPGGMPREQPPACVVAYGRGMDATILDGAYFDTCRVIGRSDRVPVRFTAVPVATTSMISSER